MNSRPANRSPRTIDSTFPIRARRALSAALCVVALGSWHGAAGAAVGDVSVAPAEPTICDAVTLAVAGTLPDDCHTLRGMRVSAPELLPTAGPLPTYRIRARVIVEGPNPMLGRPCVLAAQPYTLTAPLGRLPFGAYWVEATEYVFPFPADSTAPIDSSRATYAFHVAPDSCGSVGDCVLLGFAPADADSTPSRLDGCTARITAGDRFCFDVTLDNSMPVGGFQTEVLITPPIVNGLFQGSFQLVAATTTGRTADFDVSWSANDSVAKLLLYSASGAAIQPGRGPVLRLCYQSSPSTPSGTRCPIEFGATIVATPTGGTIDLCPTFAPIRGFVCVGGAACDVNGDGHGDIRDILMIVGCALAMEGAAYSPCPDSVRVRADCNEDGSVDVRDVICCVRRILTQGTGWSDPATPPPGASPSRIGFAGDARWISPLEGTATLVVEPGESFGGMQWIVDPGAAARVAEVVLDDPSSPFAVAWADAGDGTARVMLYPRGDAAAGGAGGSASSGAGAAAAIPVRLILEPEGEGAAGGGTLALRAVRGATLDGEALAVLPTRTSAVLPANPASAAPAVLPARPNPFVASTEIAFSLPRAGAVALRLYDVSGRLVRTLVRGPMAAGVHRATWDGRDDGGRSVGSGVYFVRYDALGGVRTQRILRLR